MIDLVNYLKNLTKTENCFGQAGLPAMEPIYLILDKDDQCNVIQYLVEYEQYKPFLPTKCVYRLDKANNKYEKDHIHVYADKKHNHQLYAVCFDGSSHDGSKYLLNTKHQEALRNIGFAVPKDGLIEWVTFDSNGCMILCD